MRLIRLPYAKDPDTRRHLLARARRVLDRSGSLDGSTESGTFQASTPFGRFAGLYHSPAGAAEIEIELTEKPWLVSLVLLESEARRFLAAI